MQTKDHNEMDFFIFNFLINFSTLEIFKIFIKGVIIRFEFLVIEQQISYCPIL